MSDNLSAGIAAVIGLGWAALSLYRLWRKNQEGFERALILAALFSIAAGVVP